MEKLLIKGGVARAEINFSLIISIVRYYFTFANHIFTDWKGSKVNLRVKYKEGWCVKLRLKPWFESGWYFCNITKLGWFWKQLSRKKALYNPFLKSLQYQSYAVKCSSKWVFLEISQYSQENICAEAPLINLQALRPLYLKETPTQVFSCEYCKTFTNTNRFFTEHLRWLLLSFW